MDIEKILKMSDIWVAKNYPDFYYHINSKELGRTWREKLYIETNNFNEIGKCYCGKELNFISFKKGWFTYCSKKCAKNSKEVKEKTIKTNIEKWGDISPMRNTLVKEKLKNVFIDKFGVDNPSKLKATKEKVKKTNIEKFGYEYVSQTPKVKEVLSNMMKTKSKEYNLSIKEKNTSYLKEKIGKYNLEFISSDGSDYQIFCPKCLSDFSIHKNMLNDRIKHNVDICTNCNKINTLTSNQLKIRDFISNYYNGEIILNDRKSIGRELDIFLPELKLAFEYNGLYWHSDAHKDKEYHIRKTKDCEKVGIKLCHIWEDDWLKKCDIIKSRIRNMLGFSNKIWARKCVIKVVSYLDSKKFLDENHSQSWVTSKVNLGLYFDEELVSLMTFGGLRANLGQRVKLGVWEMLRFTNKIDFTVVGGASKLLEYFIINYNPEKIISYSDMSWSSGNLYEKLGFSKVHTTMPTFYWVKGDKRYNRFKFRKDRLVEMGYDKNLTADEIMSNLGYTKIWGCGNTKWEMNIKNFLSL